MNAPESHVTESVPTLPRPPAAPPAPLRLGRLAMIGLALLLIAAVAGMIPRWRERRALHVATADLAVPTVVVVTPAPGKATAGLSLPAEVRAFVEAPIYARANGFLKRWLVDIGDKVQSGQLLAEIDTPELNQELARSRAELAQAEAALALSRITAARWLDLLKTASVSEQEAAEKQSDLALKGATVDAARANVRRLEELQSFARIAAPFAGTITLRKTDVGELIVAGSAKQLFRLAQTDPLRVYVRVPQTAARIIAPGQIAEMTVPELPGRIIPARVVRTSGAMEVESRTLLTELEVKNSNGEILAGSYAQVRFPEVKLDPLLTLPSNTLLFRAEGPQVGVVQTNGMVSLVPVRLGRDFGASIEVLDGVSASDKVIINPADSLVSGTKVRIVEIPAPLAGSGQTNSGGPAK
jgi:membrane fusion protein, multidrug efflux system